MKKILITGSNGFFGKHLYSKFKDIYNVDFINRTNCDLLNRQKVKQFLDGKYYDVVLHCAIEGGNRLVVDTSETLQNNLTMFFNLMSQKHKFKRFINFGSGAEYIQPYSLTPYGMSKQIISKYVQTLQDYVNLVSISTFGVNQLQRRFMSSVIACISNNQPVIIHNNKRFDFFGIRDFLMVVQHFIQEISPPNVRMDLCYKEKYTLVEIVKQFFEYDNIIVQNQNLNEPYIGTYNQYFDRFQFNGLKSQIQWLRINANS